MSATHDIKNEGLFHIGNSTHWIVFEGVSILTDPWISEPADHLLVHRVPPIDFPKNPQIILISHRHGDHFDPEALKLLDKNAFVVCPPGEIEETVLALSFSNVLAARPGDRLHVHGVTIDVVRGKHTCPEICFRLEANGHALFFGGDTMITPEIMRLADEKPASFVVLPGEYSSFLGKRFVMTPAEAVMVAKRFQARVAVLTHHETKVKSRPPWSWLVRMRSPKENDFPNWFRIPSPGDFIHFPWTQGTEVSQ